MSALSAFCNQLIAFFEDLAETYPEEGDISKAAQALKLAKQANPRLVHRLFMDNVYNESATQILNEDEEYLITKAREKLLSAKGKQLNYAYWIFDKHWTAMSETNKQQVWRYIKSLILLAGRV
jgi:hypothetical protein